MIKYKLLVTYIKIPLLKLYMLAASDVKSVKIPLRNHVFSVWPEIDFFLTPPKPNPKTKNVIFKAILGRFLFF